MGYFIPLVVQGILQVVQGILQEGFYDRGRTLDRHLHVVQYGKLLLIRESVTC